MTWRGRRGGTTDAEGTGNESPVGERAEHGERSSRPGDRRGDTGRRSKSAGAGRISDKPVKASAEDIVRSLEGHWQEDLLFQLNQEQYGNESCLEHIGRVRQAATSVSQTE